MTNTKTLSRRQFVDHTIRGSAAVLAGSPITAFANANVPATPRPKVAAIFTIFRFRSHAYNILESFFEPYLFNGKLVDPGVEIVSMYADQFPDKDMARAVSRKFKIPLYPSIDEALCLGGKKLAVDAVLSIGEHGEYPTNPLGQKMYPRKEFFDQITAVMKRSKRYVPVFNDKHLSYRWDWSREMYETSRQLGFPLMASSSVPLAQRRPLLELPAEAKITEAVSIHGGGMESYDFHGLEVLQSFVEARQGGETGISRIEFLSGKQLMRAAEEGRWSLELAEAAMKAELGEKPKSLANIPGEPSAKEPHGLLVTYKDGLRAIVLRVGSSANRWNFACRLRGETKPRATALYNGPWGNRCLFKALSHAIQHLFIHQEEPYPVERTLLVSGALDAAMHSHHRGNKPIDTPHLEFAYKPIDFRKMREMGGNWKIITSQTPQPLDFAPGDRKLMK